MIEFDPGDRDEEKVEPGLPVNNHASGGDHRGQTVGESDGLRGPTAADRVHTLSSAMSMFVYILTGQCQSQLLCAYQTQNCSKYHAQSPTICADAQELSGAHELSGPGWSA